ncbi:MAG: putative selenate reductase subunit YgfK, partial [Oscillospiraceae bacterium]|nr:putative selenate reductase subunit YgfK [Oscillospiraceae bacterium]
MSERMTPIPFGDLMNWITTEYQRDGSVFGVHKPYRAGVKKLPIFGETIETPFGPAAGPNTQLAQNIVAGYFAGARFFELKTVQKMDGAELAACINRPCILAEDECYNCEWSTELTVQQAFEEYVKAWCACKIMARVYGLGDPDGFVFNMSVGYDLEGIRGEKIDGFLNGMTDASRTPIFRECIRTLKAMFPGEAAFIDTITPHISGSVTLSTLHGCPPEEIERIASYLLTEKHLHTFVKCNPTLLGYETARSILDGMGYDYIAFDDHHFREDLQYADAVPMFRRLQQLAGEQGLEFGLKLSNTFPVDVKAGELPSEEMYMAGKSLFPLTTTMAARLSREFGGKLRISYAGGADAFNVEQLFACGIWPITMAATELKPGGYQRFVQIGDKLDALDFRPFTGVDVDGVEALSLAARSDKYHRKAVKPLPCRKLDKKVPLTDCFTAPCKGGCPIGQDIPEYIELCRKGRYGSALRVITEKNPLPFITGTICAHHCMDKCTRNYYEQPVDIRAT